TDQLFPLSLHDALPIYENMLSWRSTDNHGTKPCFRDAQQTITGRNHVFVALNRQSRDETMFSWRSTDNHGTKTCFRGAQQTITRSEEHTSELQSRGHLV